MEQLSKLDAAKRHLDVAIESYFSGKDLVPLCALVGAAHIIAHDLVETRSVFQLWFVSKIRVLFTDPAYRLAYEAALESFPNFDKRSHEEQLESGLAKLMEIRNAK